MFMDGRTDGHRRPVLKNYQCCSSKWHWRKGLILEPPAWSLRFTHHHDDEWWWSSRPHSRNVVIITIVLARSFWHKRLSSVFLQWNGHCIFWILIDSWETQKQITMDYEMVWINRDKLCPQMWVTTLSPRKWAEYVALLSNMSTEITRWIRW